jgi:ferredoxin
MPPLKEEIKTFLLSLGVDLVGFTDVSSLYDGFNTAIVFAVSEKKLTCLATERSTTLWTFISFFMDRTAFDLVWFLKKNGYSALRRYMEENYAPIHFQTNKPTIKVEFNQRLPHVELASRAGLGTRGKMGWLVTSQYGPRLWLMSVLTDAVVSYDAPQEFNPCKDCNACVDACPYLQNQKIGDPLTDCWLCSARICVHICPVGKKDGVHKERGE